MAHLLPALAQGQGPGADRDHAIGVLLAGDQHLHRGALGETLLEVGDHAQPGFGLGHEAGGLAAHIHIHPIAFNAEDDATDHLACGADRLVFIEGGKKGLLIEIEIVDGAGWCRRPLLAPIGAGGCGAHHAG